MQLGVGSGGTWSRENGLLEFGGAGKWGAGMDWVMSLRDGRPRGREHRGLGFFHGYVGRE